ncbi:hypothetical protein GCM10007103_01620 [Salinimicrobium marinum]|uniref:Kelch motif-containing protein n=1 Tax=Salinimicrobium marinum TaxID=680283 RepID=A0A918S798_9FLAO|nr:carboxypeptidase-like regulatory domain-containing protein [Salinimicrobium marinum]GHA24084.1 hypothetical protein GCM10007103_01620 [Salinimicrobium marinum]
MKRVFLLIFFLILTSSLAHAQKVTGTVLDKESNEPVEGVHVTLPAYNYSTVTNKKGEFIIGLKAELSEKDSLYFTYVGYTTARFTLSQLQKMNHTVFLEVSLEELKEITLDSDRKLQPKIRFKKLASLDTKMYAFGSVLANDKIYVAGGNQSYVENGMRREMETNLAATLQDILDASSQNFSWEKYNGSLQVYDIKSDTWSMPQLELIERANHNLNYYDDKIIISGGTTVSLNGKYEYLADKIEIIDLKKDSVLVDKANPHRALGGATFIYEDNMILMGGSSKMKRNGTKDYLDKVHLYNFESGLWYEMAHMPLPKETQGVLLENKIFLVGGSRETALGGIESFDVTTGRWKKEAELMETSAAPAVTHHEKTIYFFDNGKIGSYHTETGELKEYKIDLKIQGAGLHYANDKLYIIGGFEEYKFRTRPLAGCYSIELAEFDLTEVARAIGF